MAEERILAEVPGIRLSRTRIDYRVKVSFLSSFFSGISHIAGSVPLQHVNTIHIVQRRASCVLLSIIFGFIMLLTTSFMMVLAPDLVFLSILPPAGLVLLIFFTYRQSEIAIFSEGEEIVSSSLAGGLEQTERFIHIYNRLKAQELAAALQPIQRSSDTMAKQPESTFEDPFQMS